MTLKVIDTTTGKEPTDRVINNIAKNGGLMICDIDGFYVGEDGQIILVDDCGNATWVDMDRFKAVPDVFDKIRAKIERVLNTERDFTTESAKAQAIALRWCIEIIDKYRDMDEITEHYKKLGEYYNGKDV
jgi:hypothetical protein